MADAQHPAIFTVHTPSGVSQCCVKHARGIEKLARRLGFHVNATRAPDDAQCGNCVNEARTVTPKEPTP